jgi:periplasmic divalent cation tolerance protein
MPLKYPLKTLVEGSGEVLLITTVADAEHAETFARSLVENKLAACVSCLPGATSFYHWEDNGITRDTEHVLLIKTHYDRLADIERFFEDEHPYELPELLVLEINALSKSYRDWMLDEIAGR